MDSSSSTFQAPRNSYPRKLASFDPELPIEEQVSILTKIRNQCEKQWFMYVKREKKLKNEISRLKYKMLDVSSENKYLKTKIEQADDLYNKYQTLKESHQKLKKDADGLHSQYQRLRKEYNKLLK